MKDEQEDRDRYKLQEQKKYEALERQLDNERKNYQREIQEVKNKETSVLSFEFRIIESEEKLKTANANIRSLQQELKQSNKRYVRIKVRDLLLLSFCYVNPINKKQRCYN